MSELSDRPGVTAERDRFALDVVGIGAINLDYIVNVSDSPEDQAEHPRSLAARVATLVRGSGARLEMGVELHVDGDTIDAVMDAVSSATAETYLGGSAFNAVHAIAKTQVGLRLGYVGIAGRVPVIGMSSIQELEALGIDHRFVLRADEDVSGICFSLCENGDRTLLTYAGANQQMADYIASEFTNLVTYLSRARVIHVTSFLDSRTAGRLLALLQEVKKVSPETAICFDPGHVWSVDAAPEVAGLVQISDYLLVNYREFHELSGHSPDQSDDELAERLLSSFDGQRGVIVVKRPAGIWCYRQEEGKLLSDFYHQTPVPSEEVEDSTGAGDVFAAGLLIVLTYDRLKIELGSLLGMRLASHKLRYVGSSGHAQFAAVTRDFIRRLDGERRSIDAPNGVFIAHGANPEWLAVQRFIEERFDLPVYSFESSPWGGHQVTEALSDYLERCSFAICVLTAEDFTGDGRHLARQNVVHEIGLFQGRHGFSRVIVLVEEGCDFVPPSARPFMITFPHNGVTQTFYQLAKMFRSSGIDGTEEQ